MRGAAFERAYGTAGGAKPRRVNPKSGTGMKQARQVTKGAKRRGGEKSRGCNVTGWLGSTGGRWLFVARKTLKGNKPWKGRVSVAYAKHRHFAVTYW